MARVTVEDCILKLDNRYELVLLSSYRARELSNGAEPNLPRDNDKNTVISLREIAEDKVSTEDLRAKYASFIKQGFKLPQAEEEVADEVKLELSAEGFDEEDLDEMQIDSEEASETEEAQVEE